MDLTPGPGEDQKRSEEPEACYVYVNRDLEVARTIEISDSINVDVDAAGGVHGIELIGSMQWMDMLYQQVLRALPQKIYGAAYRAGLQAANNAITWDTTCLNCSALLDIGIREREAGYREGREDAARDLLAYGIPDAELPAGRRILFDRNHAAEIARGSDQPRTPLAHVSGDTESSPEVERAGG